MKVVCEVGGVYPGVIVHGSYIFVYSYCGFIDDVLMVGESTAIFVVCAKVNGDEVTNNHITCQLVVSPSPRVVFPLSCALSLSTRGIWVPPSFFL